MRNHLKTPKEFDSSKFQLNPMVKLYERHIQVTVRQICHFFQNFELAARWPRITLRAYRKYALRVIWVVREPQECTRMIPNSFSEHFRKTLKISLLSQSCDINAPRFAHAKIHNMKQSGCETKAKTHNLERKTYPGPSWRWDFAHWALRDAKLTKMSVLRDFKTSCPVTPYYS